MKNKGAIVDKDICESIGCVSESDKDYSFVFTNGNSNIMYSIIPTAMDVFIPNKSFNFSFNLLQMKVIERCNDCKMLNTFLKKILHYNSKQELILDRDKLEKVNPLLLKYVYPERSNKDNWHIEIRFIILTQKA
jgi:hypothetical protein